MDKISLSGTLKSYEISFVYMCVVVLFPSATL